MAELTRPQVGDWVTVKVNGEEISARIRAITGDYCKLQLSRYVYLDGHRTGVCVVKVRDIRIGERCIVNLA